MFLGGLDRSSGLELLERTVGRVLTEEESNWAGDLWFESEGLPLRFMQAGALLRQRDRLQANEDVFDDFGVFQDAPVDAPFEAAGGNDVPLPSLAEGAAPAALLASRLSASARATLRFAMALDGEVPHQTHLPALVDDTHADAALAELAGCALVSRSAPATGSRPVCRPSWRSPDTPTGSRSRPAPRPSTTPGGPGIPRSLRSGSAPRPTPFSPRSPSWSRSPRPRSTSRTRASPCSWPARPRPRSPGTALERLGAGAAGRRRGLRLAGEVGEQAYFHHELGILALCGGSLDRARAELESSIGLRGALADKRGTVAGRRALALVADRSGAVLPGGRTAAGEEVPDARHEESASPPGGVPAAFALPAPALEPSTLVTNRVEPGLPVKRVGVGSRLVSGTRRNLVAAGAGALLAAVLGTVVTLGATSNNNGDTPSEKVGVNPSASQGGQDDSLGADKAKKDGGGGSDAGVVTAPTDPGPDGTYGTSDDPTPPAGTSGQPSDTPSGTHGGGGGGTSPSPSKSTSTPPTKSPSPSPSKSTSSSPSQSPSETPSETPPTSTSPSPSLSNSASGPASSVPASATAGAPESSAATVPQSSGAVGSPSGSVI